MGTLKSYLRVCGSANPPGIKARLYAADCCDFDGWPETVLETTPLSVDPDAEITLDEAFTMKASKKFKYIDVVIDSGAFTSDKIGEIDAEAFDNGVNFRIAGTSPRQIAVFAGIARSCGVWVVETTAKYRIVIGTKDRPAHCESAAMTSGAALTDGNGTDYVLKASNILPPLYYPADLAMVIEAEPA